VSTFALQFRGGLAACLFFQAVEMVCK